MRGSVKRLIFMMVLIAWLAAMAGGSAVLDRYANTPGQFGSPSFEFPRESHIQPDDLDRPVLVLFLHPRCPCSRATLAELEGLMSRTEGLAQVFAVFVKPVGFISKNIVERHGGRLIVESQYGAGSTFIAELPTR